MSKRNNIIEEHWRQNYSRLVKVVTRRVPNNSRPIAEEAVQDAYTNALKYFRTYDPAKSVFKTWFDKILNNSVNRVRMSESGAGSSKEIDDNTPALGITKDERELLQLILQDINTTKGIERDILVMFYFNGFKSIEIADFLNRKHDNVRQIIFRWRNRVGLVIPS